MKESRLIAIAMVAASAVAACTESPDPEEENQENNQTGGDSGEQTPSSLPNLLYIFPDQYRLYALSIWSNPEYSDILSTMGDPVITPNIDRIFSEGVIFTQATSTQPLSSPHRGMLMSGMFPELNGVYNNCYIGRDAGLHEDIECFTDVLSDAGYSTVYVGKTHWEPTEALFDSEGVYVGTTSYPGGNYINNYDTYIPEGASRHSNSFWYQHIVDSHFSPIAYSNQPQLINGYPDGTPYTTSAFSTTTEANAIIEYIEGYDKEQPFSIFWAPNPPHPPYSSINHCDQSIYNAYFKDIPLEELMVRENVSSSDAETIARVYFSLIKGVDDEIGRVLDLLDAKGLTSNTIIVFTSDHGEMLGSQDLTGKNVIYDESFLVPFSIKYPGHISHHTEDLLLGSVDIMPTMLGIMGLSDKIPSSVQGVDYSQGLISGSFADGEKPLTAPYIHINNRGLRSDKYTYHISSNGEYLLFNNEDDPYQMNPISLDDIPSEDATMLKEELGRWLTKAQDDWSKTKMHSDLIIY